MRNNKILKLLIFVLILFCYSNALAREVLIKDKLGRIIKLKIPVKRAVIILTPDLIPALNLWNQVVGVSNWVCREYRFFNFIKPGWIDRITPIGGGMGRNINVETILHLKPDVIITGAFYPGVVNFMERKGLKVIAINPQTIADYYKVIKMFGLIFGKEKRAEFVVKEMKKILKLISLRLKNVKREKKVLWVYRASPLGIACKKTITVDILHKLKLINIGPLINPGCNKPLIEVPLESVVKFDPDVIFLWGYSTLYPRDIYRNPGWQAIKAVKKKRVYRVPRKLGTWTPSLALLALWIAKKVYPERFKDINFLLYANSFCKKVYHIPYTMINY